MTKPSLTKAFFTILILLFVSVHSYSQCTGPANDCDGDGILDMDDLDDDNDGILSIDEGCTNITTSESAGSFGVLAPGVRTRNLENPPGGGYVYRSTTNNLAGQYAIISQSTSNPRWHQLTDFWTYAGHTTSQPNDGYLAVNGSTRVGAFFQDTLTLTAGVPYTYSIWHAPANLNNPYALRIRVLQGSTVVDSASTGDKNPLIWRPLALSFIPPTTGSYRIELVNTTVTSGGNDFSIDDVNFISGCNRDSDGDGTSDHFDTDSDNDGCPDAIEGNLNFSLADLDTNKRLAGAVGPNGIPTKAPSGQEAGTSYNSSQNACNAVAYPVSFAVEGTPQSVVLDTVQGSENGSPQGNWNGSFVYIEQLPTNGFILYYQGDPITQPLTIEEYDPSEFTIAPGPTTPNGTDSTLFKYGVIGTTEISSAPVDYIVRFSEPYALPVEFGEINATVSNNQLFVDWTSISETNNHHYEIEASSDGRKFFKIGNVASKADGGNSSLKIEYSFTKNISDLMAAGISLSFMALFMSSLFGRGKRKYLLLLISFMLIYGIACNKRDKDAISSGENIFVRIAQVDKDGNKAYSKVVKAIRN